MRELMVVKDVLLQSTFPELLPAGASSGPLPFFWWPTETNREGNGRSSSSEDDARSTDEEDRLLTKRCIKVLWKNTSLEQTLV